MFFRYNYQGIAWALLILILCGLPGEQFAKSKLENVDSVIHIILYSVLFVLLSVGFIKQSSFRKLRIRPLRKVFLICLGYGILLEVLQETVFIGRSIELSDILFNSLGALIGMGVFMSIYGRKAYL